MHFSDFVLIKIVIGRLFQSQSWSAQTLVWVSGLLSEPQASQSCCDNIMFDLHDCNLDKFLRELLVSACRGTNETATSEDFQHPVDKL